MRTIVKRNGTEVEFNPDKITTAVANAFKSSNEIPAWHIPYKARIITEIVESELMSKYDSEDEYKTTVEEVQDLVEDALMSARMVKTAKNYVIYREQHRKNRETNTLLDYKKIVDDYLKINDWRVKENSTVTYSLGALILSNSGAITANYWLSEVYDNEIANAHRDARMHIHDLSLLAPYCAGWNLKQLIQEGLGGVTGKISSKPASHLSTLCNQMVNFLGITQNEWCGAQAFSSFDTYLAPFVKVDNLDYHQVKQCVQSFVFGVNTPSRWGGQAPFTNITLDWVCPKDLANLPAIVGGKEMDFTYGDCKKEMDMVNKAFIEVMIEGDANGRGHQYPIPSYSITKDFDWSDTENNRLLFEMTAKYGTPYFSNYINSDMEPSDVRSMCPLTPETKVLVKSKENGIRIATIHDIINGITKKGTKYKVWTPNGWKSAKPVKVPATKVYEITMSNGTVVRMGKDHLQPTRDNGTLHADELKKGMWIPYNKDVVKSEDVGSYELGFAVGAYIGDGSHDKDAITYTICNFDKSDKVEEELVKFWKHIGYRVSVDHRDNVRFIRVIGGAYDIIKKYVNGSNALEKSMKNRIFNSSPEFKEGLIKGICMTDGARAKKRIYTSSEEMRDNLNQLFNMLGRKTMINYEDNRDGRLGTNTNYRIDYPERDRYGKLYDTDDQFNYYMITNIDTVDYSGKYLYCFEVDTDDHLFMLANGMYTHNCRLRLDLRELRRKGGGFFGAGESTGSIGVVTINLPHIAYEAENEEEFYRKLDNLMDIAARSLKMKRNVVSDLLEKGLYPYTKRYLGSFDNHFSTIGLVGMNEAGLNAKWLKKDLTHVETQKFAKDVLNHMRERLSDYQELYGDLYNLEATPAESTSYRFAKHDKERYPDIITANENGTPYYTNSSHLPVGFTDDIFAALDIQDELQTLYTSGTVFHAFLGEKLPDWKAAANLVRKIAENYKLPYYTMSPTYSICPDHGYLNGEQYTCPHCGKTTEVYSRITGYYRPVQNWNDGKTQEFKDRKVYDLGTGHIMAKTEAEEAPAFDCDTCKVDIDGQEELVMPAAAETTESKLMLFTTHTCPNCARAKEYLAEAGIDYQLIYADDDKALARQYRVMMAPTMIEFTPDGYNKYAGVGEIITYIKKH